MVFPESGYRNLPSGTAEIPGLDPDWQTVPKRFDQTVTVPDHGSVAVKTGSTLKIRRLNDSRSRSGGGSAAGVEYSELITELEQPVNAGETLYFDLMLALADSEDVNYGIYVETPPEPTGSFQVDGTSVLGTFSGGSYDQESFNDAAGTVRGGVNGGYSVMRVRGVLGNGDNAGLLRFRLGPAVEFPEPLGNGGITTSVCVFV